MKELKFNEEMQRAIDEGRKTQTRRVIEGDPVQTLVLYDCPYGYIGDVNNGIQISNVRVERLQDISEEDCIAEGIVNAKPFGYRYDGFSQFRTAENAFGYLWQSIYPNHPTKAWDLNPWVWVIEFESIN